MAAGVIQQPAQPQLQVLLERQPGAQETPGEEESPGDEGERCHRLPRYLPFLATALELRNQPHGN